MTVLSKRVLYITHDGQLYGSQYSLMLILKAVLRPVEPEDPIQIQPFVSIARPGPLNDRLAELSDITLLKHQRLQWFKHDRRSGLQRIGDWLALVVNIPARVWCLRQLIQKHRIDLVHTNSTVSLEGALAAKWAGIPHVWHIRELFMEDSPKLQPVLGKRLTRWLVDHLSNRVLCISRAVWRQFGLETGKASSTGDKAHGENKTPVSRLSKYQILYNALDPATVPAILPERHASESYVFWQSPLRLGYVGRLSEGKRFHDILDAMAILKARASLGPDSTESGLAESGPTLSVAGAFVDTAYEQRVLEKIRAAGLANQVRLLGYQSDLAAFYADIDLLIVPSLNEPFGRVVIEAMAAGVPCLGADSGGIPEIITQGETGWLYPAADAQALAQQLLERMQAPEGLSRIRENALRMVRERFTMEQQRQHLLAIYHDLLQADLLQDV